MKKPHPLGEPFMSVSSLKELRHNILTGKRQIDITADISGMTEQLFLSHIKPITDIFQPAISQLSENTSGNLYRARSCRENNNEPYSNLKDLLNNSVPSGRAINAPDTPILYASTSKQTCLAELRPKIGERLNIVHFDYSGIQDDYFWFIGHIAAFQRSHQLSPHIRDPRPVQVLAYYPEEAQHSWVFKDSLINEIFSNLSTHVDGYALNRLLIGEIEKKLPNDRPLGGVVFMSTCDAPGTNFAVFGESIQRLSPEIVNLVEVTDIDDFGYVACKLLDNAKPNEGSLEWSGSN